VDESPPTQPRRTTRFERIPPGRAACAPAGSRVRPLFPSFRRSTMFTYLWKSLTTRSDLGRSPARARKNRASLHVTALEERSLMDAGALDTSFTDGDGGNGLLTVPFDVGGPHADHGMATAVQTDGKIVVVGWAQGPNGDHDFAVTRL